MPTSTGTSRLLRLYPPAWRARYGEEFLETLGDVGLHPQLVIDMVSGAIDAWLSADVRRALRDPNDERLAETPKPGGRRPMSTRTLIACGSTRSRMSTRDALLAAGAMLGVSALLAGLLLVAARRGWSDSTIAILQMLAFPGSLVLTMPLMFLKGQPWRAQAVITGGLLAILVGIAYLSSLV
jgi:hypothetical protein